MKAFVPVGVVALVLALPAAAASGINGINGSMPNRISMNVTVAKQTQGATLKIDIGCGGEACFIALPGGDGVRADLGVLRMSPLDAAGRQALLGGALPGGSIVSAAVSSLAGQGGGTAAASYAASGRMAGPAAKPVQEAAPAPLPSRRASAGAFDITQPLADGDYVLVVVAERAGSGLKDTLKTQVRAAPPKVKVELVFSVQGGVLKTRHDTAKNSVSNIR